MSTTPIKNKTVLLKEYVQLEVKIEKSAVEQTWDLARWLADNVPNLGPSVQNANRGVLTIKDIAARGYRGAKPLQALRQTALSFGDKALPGVCVSEHRSALRRSKGDIDKALSLMHSGSKAYKEEQKKSNAARTARRRETGSERILSTPARSLMAVISFARTTTKRLEEQPLDKTLRGVMGYRTEELEELLWQAEEELELVRGAIENRDAAKRARKKQLHARRESARRAASKSALKSVA